MGRPSIRIKADPLRMSARPNERNQSRLGLVVGKRNVARATDRNRIKRWVRECFRALPDELEPYDIVVRVVAPAPVREDVQGLFRRFEQRCLGSS